MSIELGVRGSFRAWGAFAIALAVLGGCQSTGTSVRPAAPPPAAAPAPPPAIAPAAPAPPTAEQIQKELEQTAQRDLEEGTALYDKGDYNAAVDRLTNSTAIAAGPVPVRVAAHKYAAFSYCVTRRVTQCRAQFEAAFKLDPAFDLAPAERGHPLWGPAYDRVKRSQSAAKK